jgi:hypothetical protein
MVRGVYRFTTQVLGPGWTGADNIQNNGFMIHCAAPVSQTKDYPPSVEVQLIGPANDFFKNQWNLGAQGWKYPTSTNLCANGVTVNLNGSDVSSNCHPANYPADWKGTDIPWDDGEGWSDATVRVLSDSLFQHYIHGSKVFEYTRIRRDGQPLKDGYLAVQAEGSSTQFKTLEYLDLVGCMDRASPNYRTYFVKNDPAACAATGVAGEKSGNTLDLIRVGNRFIVNDRHASISEVRHIDGTRVDLESNAQTFTPKRSGIYLVAIRSKDGVHVQRVTWVSSHERAR